MSVALSTGSKPREPTLRRMTPPHVLNPEITAPLDAAPADVVHPHLHGACLSARRLHLHGAFLSTRRLHHWRVLSAKRPHHWRLLSAKRPRLWRLLSARRPHLAMCEGALHPTHGAPCAISTKKPTSSKAWRSQRNAASFLISLMRATSLNLKPDGARCASRSAQRDRRRALRVSFGTDDTRCVSPSVRRTKPHTNTPPTAHSQRPARHLHRDPFSSYYQRSASAHIATSPNATKLRRTAVRAARSRLPKAQLDTTRISSKRAPGRSATAAISVTAEITLDPWDHFYKNGITLVISLIIKVISEITFTKTHEGSQAFSAAFFRLA